MSKNEAPSKSKSKAKRTEIPTLPNPSPTEPGTKPGYIPLRERLQRAAAARRRRV